MLVESVHDVWRLGFLAGEVVPCRARDSPGRGDLNPQRVVCKLLFFAGYVAGVAFCS